MAHERRDAYEILGVSRESPRAVVDKEYRRKATREHRLLEFDEGAVRRLHELNEAYAVLTRAAPLDRNGYVLVALLAGGLLAGYLLDVNRRVFVYAPVIIGMAGFFWLVDTLHRRSTQPKTPPLTAESVAREAVRLLGGPLETPAVSAKVEPPASGAYLAEPLFVGDADDPAASFAAGTGLPLELDFLLSVTEQTRIVTLPIVTGERQPQSIQIHSLRPMGEGDLLEIHLVVETDGQVRIDVRDPYADCSLRLELTSPLLASVAVAGYRA